MWRLYRHAKRAYFAIYSSFMLSKQISGAQFIFVKCFPAGCYWCYSKLWAGKIWAHLKMTSFGHDPAAYSRDNTRTDCSNLELSAALETGHLLPLHLITLFHAELDQAEDSILPASAYDDFIFFPFLVIRRTWNLFSPSIWGFWAPEWLNLTTSFISGRRKSWQLMKLCLIVIYDILKRYFEGGKHISPKIK